MLSCLCTSLGPDGLGPPPTVDRVPRGPSPAVAVGGVHIDPEVQQELHDVVVAGADGVV